MRVPVIYCPNYFVDKEGCIYSTNGRNIKKHLVGEKQYPYHGVILSNNGKRYNKRVNRLVYFSFNPEADQSLEVHHINGDRLDNRLKNLELISHKKNCFLKFERKDVSKYGKNIQVNEYGKFRVQIRYNGKRYSANFTNLKDAIEYRENKCRKLCKDGKSHL